MEITKQKECLIEEEIDRIEINRIEQSLSAKDK